MEEEENAGVEELDQDAPTDQEALENDESDGATDSEEDTDIDYKAELARVTEEKENYKNGMLAAKDKLKNKKPSIDPEEIARIVGEAVQKEVQTLTGMFTKNTLETSIASMTSNKAKQDLIRFHYENSIVKTGTDPQSLKNDLENALLIADKKALLKKNQELEVANQNRSQMQNSSQGSSQKQGIEKKFFSDEQLRDLKKRGFTDEMIKNLQLKMSPKKK